MSEILVTGANGQLGRCLQKISKEYSDDAFFFKDSKELDIIDIDRIDALYMANDFEYCINCAAYTNVEQAEKKPELAFLVNAEGVKNLADVCNKYDVTLIHISTDYVFDGEKESPYLPTDKTNPINQYGKSKLKGEEYIQEIMSKYHIVRTSWLYSQFGKNFL